MRLPTPCGVHSFSAHMKIAIGAKPSAEKGGYEDEGCLKYVSRSVVFLQCSAPLVYADGASASNLSTNLSL
jgi:hypothetical protein